MGNSDLFQSWLRPEVLNPLPMTTGQAIPSVAATRAASGKGIGRCLLRHKPLWSDDFSNRPAYLCTSRSP